MFLSICHALSDGPGALRMARSLLVHLGNIVDGKEDVNSPWSKPQPLIDLQALLFGWDYRDRPPCASSSEQPNALFDGTDDIVAALESTSFSNPSINGMVLLPPEAMQKLPTDPGFFGPTVIGTLQFSITPEETAAL
jgi:hypothetical protein